ncbi:hypothetical protein BGZ46_008169 [Entomortierella lignicola]|nr:hypothetical protein BGZ46_008169 [Entomortierella lignicola]
MESHAPTLDSMLKSCVFTEKPKSQPLEMTKTQFEELIGLALDVEFDLNVISDTTDPEFGNEDSGSDSELLGKIPVHLKIKELKIGGSLVPKMIAENWNLKVDPLNFGNIHNVV